MRTILPLLVAMMIAGPALAQERTRSLVKYDNVEIDLIAEGRGPLIVLLPSRGRDSEDYDEVAAGLAKEGFRVLRPQPRGMHASKGPLKDITLHDLARDIATVIDARERRARGDRRPRLRQLGRAHDRGGSSRSWCAASCSPRRRRRSFRRGSRQLVSKSADQSVPEAERLAAMQEIFFASGNDPKIWLKGWWAEASEAQRVAAANVKQSDWWHAGTVPLFDLQAGIDPFMPEGIAQRAEGRVSRPRDGRGDPEREPRAAAGAAGRGGAGDRRVGEEAMT